MHLELNEDEIIEMKRFYITQYDKALRDLNHIKSVLQKLGADTSDLRTVQQSQSHARFLKHASMISPEQIDGHNERKKGTRGRKSLWGNFILNLLNELARPLSYTQIIGEAMERFNLPESKTKNVKQAITNSAFRLRVINHKIDTYGLPGKKERFLCLMEWFENNDLKQDMKNKIS